MSREVVADAGPLIALAITGHLPLLVELFDRVLIPEAVRDELELSSERPGARALSEGIGSAGWLVVKKVRTQARFVSALDPGERQAILLASRENVPLLIDERRGRRAARDAGVQPIGTGRMLLAAKDHKLIERVGPILDELREAGYRLSDPLVQHLRDLADEA